MSERRFNEAEVAAIFERAAEVQQSRSLQPSSAEGLTLAELLQIGRDVGIPAESITSAAQSIGRVQLPNKRTFLGLPLGVARTVHLDRNLSDEEWDKLVVDLRETFDARGNVTSQGSLRQWTNGNLQVLLEPTAKGHRIRLRTIKSDALGMLVGGMGMVGLSAFILLMAAVRGALGDRGMLMATGFLGIWGGAMFASSALRLPRWARTREQQMEEIAARVTLLTSTSMAPASDNEP